MQMITNIIAFAALIIAIISLCLQLIEKRSHLDIYPTIRNITLPPLSIGKMNVPVLSIYLSNPSEKPIHIVNVWLCFNKTLEIQLFEYNAMCPRLEQPFTIDPHRGRYFIVEGKEILEDISTREVIGDIRAIVLVKDEMRRNYESKPINFSMNQLRAGQ